MNIKLKVTLLSAIITLGISSLSAQNLKPYILGIESTKSVYDLKVAVKSNLEGRPPVFSEASNSRSS